MAGHMDVNFVSYAIGDEFVGDDSNLHLFKVPLDVEGGGITILYAHFTMLGTTGAGTAFDLRLVTWGTAGTAVDGTISGALGGTADVFAASTPKAFTITSPFVDAGKWVVVNKQETNSSDPDRGTLSIAYVMGR